MKIQELLENAHVAVILDTHRGGHLGSDIGNLSREVIRKGRVKPDGTVTDEWKRYMSLFADNEAQLNRLIELTEAGYLPKAQAYIVSNGTCGASTDTFTGKGIDATQFDPLEPDPTPDGRVVDPGTPAGPGVFVRPFVIPRI